MALKADSDGFLVGDPVNVDRGGYDRAIALWRSIREDTRAIRQALEGGIERGRAPAARRGPSVLPQRGPDGRFVRSTPPAATPNREASGARGPSVLPQRGPDGRFLSAAQPRRQSDSAQGASPVLESDWGDADSGASGVIRRTAAAVGQSLARSLPQAAQGTEQIDPTLQAAKEIKDTLAPIAEPVGALAGGLLSGGERRKERRQAREQARETAKETERKNVPWYKRILRALGGPKAAESGGGTGGMLLPLLVTALTGILKPLLALKAGLTTLATAVPGFSKLLGKLALPISGMISAVGSFNTSTEEYASRLGVELDGSLAQEMAVRFVGALGDLGNTLTFGLADKFGSWLSESVGNPFEKLAQAKDSAGAAVRGLMDRGLDLIGRGPEAKRKALMAQMDAAGMTDPRERAMFLAQMDHETGGFRNLEEGFNYTPDRLMAVSATARRAGPQAVQEAIAKGPEAVAELMYGGRMGNTEAGDAYRFRGRGYTQLTGRANYEEAGKALGLDLVGNPDLAASPEVAAKIATWFWKSRGASEAAQQGDVAGVTRLINGGLNGLEGRMAKTDQYLAAANVGGLSPAAKGSAIPRGAAAATAGVSLHTARASAAPSVDSHRAPPPPPITSHLGSGSRGGDKVEVIVPIPLTQNLSDRNIAQVATGGLGGNMSD